MFIFIAFFLILLVEMLALSIKESHGALQMVIRVEVGEIFGEIWLNFLFKVFLALIVLSVAVNKLNF